MDYPHLIAHNGFIQMAFATAEQTAEVWKVNVERLERIEN